MKISVVISWHPIVIAWLHAYDIVGIIKDH